MRRSGWSWNTPRPWNTRGERLRLRLRPAPRLASVPIVILILIEILIAQRPASAQKGLPMTPERLDGLTQGRTMDLRARALTLTQVLPGLTQQMLYRVRLTPEAADLPLSVFCSGARLSQFEHAITALFGYRLVGRSQGEGMGLVFVPDPQTVAAAGRRRLQGRAAVELGIERANTWLKQPAQFAAAARTSCPAAGALRDESVKRAFALHAALSAAQHAVVMGGHPVVVPYAALPARSRSLLPAGKPAPRWLTFYLYTNPWSLNDALRLAVRAEPAGQTWLSCPPLDLVPAHLPSGAEADPVFKARLTGEPDLEDLETGEEAPAMLEWMADQGKVWIMAEALRPNAGGVAQLKKLAASCRGLTLQEGLDRVAGFFGATWRVDDGWILIQRRSVSD
jgi:hypothetical protein